VRLCLLLVLGATASTRLTIAQEPASVEASIPVSTFGTTVVVPGGMVGDVYLLPEHTTVLPDFASQALEKAGKIWTDALNVPPHHWRAGFPGLTDRFEWFAIDYTGKFWIEQPGRYVFGLLSDDGSRLFLDDIPVIDNDCMHPPDLRVAAVELQGGVHHIRVSYFQGPRDCLSLVLAMAGADHQWKVFSTKDLKPPTNPDEWHFMAQNAVSIVPVTPEEASLTASALLQQLGGSEQDDKPRKEKKNQETCAVFPAVRTCSN
jgi:hypothetical protein